MILLSISSGELAAVISALCAAATVLLFPLLKFLKRVFCKLRSKHNVLDKLPELVLKLDKKIDKLQEDVEEIKEQQFVMSNQQEAYEKHFDEYETQQLRYMISDVFFSYSSIEDIPDEMLLNAEENCGIYLGKGLNHETAARCKVIEKEIERRAILRKGR